MEETSRYLTAEKKMPFWSSEWIHLKKMQFGRSFSFWYILLLIWKLVELFAYIGVGLVIFNSIQNVIKLKPNIKWHLKWHFIPFFML